MVMAPKENLDYRPDQEYESRNDRDEWNVVGLVGQVYIRCDETVKAGDLIIADSGIATKAVQPEQCWQVMRITSEYDAQRGYGIALVFIR